MDLDHDFFQVSKLSEDQFLGERIKRRPKKKNFSPNSGEDQKKKQKKKKVFTKNGTLFFPNSSGDLHSDAYWNQIIGEDADEDHTQIMGGDTAKLLGGYIPPGFWPSCTWI